MKFRARYVALSMAVVAGCSDSSGGGAGGGGAGGGEQASSSSDTSSSSSGSGPCDAYDGDGSLPDGCEEWIVAECEALSEEDCVASVPIGVTNQVGCALAGIVTEENDCEATEPLRCVAGLDLGDGGFPRGVDGDEVIHVVCTEGRDFCPGSLLSGEACPPSGGPGYCGCGTP
jgi:hypothetical protein